MSDKNNNQQNQTGGFVLELYEWLEAIAFALAIVVILFTYLLRVVSVSGPSMNPTLASGDRIVLNSLFYTPQNGDIVVITQPNSHDNEPLVKRIIAVEGQTISIDAETDTVTVDGDYVFTAGKWNGMVFHPYSPDEIHSLVPGISMKAFASADSGTVVVFEKPAEQRG